MSLNNQNLINRLKKLAFNIEKGSEKDFEELNKTIKEMGELMSQKFNSKNEIINFILKEKIFSRLAKNQNEERNIILNLFFQQFTLNPKTIQYIYGDIRDAFSDNQEFVNKNNLYRNTLAERADIVDTVLTSFLQNNTKNQLHEVQSLINFYLESFNITKSDIDEIWEQSKGKGYKKEENFVKQILININKQSVLSEPFTINNNSIIFNQKTSGLPDVLLYNEKTNRFTIGFATLSNNPDRELGSFYKHPISLMLLIKSMQYDMYGEDKHFKSVKDVRKRLDYKLTDLLKGKRSIMYPKAGSEPKWIESLVREFHSEQVRVNSDSKNTLLRFIDNFYGKLQKDGIRIHKEFFNDESEEFIFQLENGFLETLNNSILEDGSGLDIFYFGTVKSPKIKSKQNKNSEYTSEESIALINTLSYLSVTGGGFQSIVMDENETLNYIELIKFRFNTSTTKFNIIDLDKINDNKTEFLRFYIDDFISPYLENPKHKMELNKQIYQNCASIDYWILNHMQQKIKEGERNRSIQIIEKELKLIGCKNTDAETFLESIRAKFFTRRNGKGSETYALTESIKEKIKQEKEEMRREGEKIRALINPKTKTPAN